MRVRRKPQECRRMPHECRRMPQECRRSRITSRRSRITSRRSTFPDAVPTFPVAVPVPTFPVAVPVLPVLARSPFSRSSRGLRSSGPRVVSVSRASAPLRLSRVLRSSDSRVFCRSPTLACSSFFRPSRAPAACSCRLLLHSCTNIFAARTSFSDLSLIYFLRRSSSARCGRPLFNTLSHSEHS